VMAAEALILNFDRNVTPGAMSIQHPWRLWQWRRNILTLRTSDFRIVCYRSYEATKVMAISRASIKQRDFRVEGWS
jgi:hypothetical protein